MTQPSPTHLVHVFPTFAVGGSQARFAQLVAAHGTRYRHTVIALDNITTMHDRLAPDAPVSLLKVDFDKSAGLRNIPLFRRVLRQLRPDTIVTYNWGSIEWCLANRLIPVARHVHIEDGFGPEEKSRQIPRRVLTRRLALSGHHTTIVLPSRQLENLARNIWRLPAGQIQYVPNGVNLARFAPQAITKSSGDDLVIGTIATLRAEKNLGRLITAFAALASQPIYARISLVIVGDGSERPALEGMAQATGLGDRIRFAGPTTTPELSLRGIDIFALSSDTEQMPLSILEAMAAYLPIASVAVGDVIDMVADANRPYITALGDEAAFIASLKQLVDDAALRNHLGAENGRAAADRFDQSHMIDRYQALFG